MSQSSHAGRNTPGQSAGAAVIDALLAQNAHKGSDPAARRHVRNRWKVDLRIEIEESIDVGTISRELNVTTQDLSRGGYSFLCRQYLHDGTQVRAQVESLPGSPILVGTVVNCSYAGAGQHRVGIKFLLTKS